MAAGIAPEPTPEVYSLNKEKFKKYTFKTVKARIETGLFVS